MWGLSQPLGNCAESQNDLGCLFKNTDVHPSSRESLIRQFWDEAQLLKFGVIGPGNSDAHQSLKFTWGFGFFALQNLALVTIDPYLNHSFPPKSWLASCCSHTFLSPDPTGKSALSVHAEYACSDLKERRPCFKMGWECQHQFSSMMKTKCNF